MCGAWRAGGVSKGLGGGPGVGHQADAVCVPLQRACCGLWVASASQRASVPCVLYTCACTQARLLVAGAYETTVKLVQEKRELIEQMAAVLLEKEVRGKPWLQWGVRGGGWR